MYNFPIKDLVVWFQETLGDLFPSLYEIKRLEEVVLFTVGLMDDPTALVDHVYQMYIKRIQRAGILGHVDTDEEEKLVSLGKDINDMHLYQSLYRESSTVIPGSAFHNQHLNYYPEDDSEPIYFPSTLFIFDRAKNIEYATIGNSSEDLIKRKSVDSIILSTRSENTESLLTTIRRISKLQPIGVLLMFHINCTSHQSTHVFNMSNKCLFVVLWDCTLPSSTLDHLFQQISACSTLHTIDVRYTNLGDMASLALRDLPSLTKLRLWKVNLCRFHLLHLAYLVENRKLPNLRELDIGGNKLNHLQDELDIFLQVVAKNHQTHITVDIQLSNLPNSFWQKVRKYTEPPSLLHISGSSLIGTSRIIIITGDVEELNKEINPAQFFLQKAIHYLETVQNISFADCNLPRYLCGPLLKVLSSHRNLSHLDLSGNTLGIHGAHLVNAIKTWGPEPSLQELDLSHCSLPVEVCRPLLSVLGRCRSLTELWLPGNTVTGCLQNFLADHESRLPSGAVSELHEVEHARSTAFKSTDSGREDATAEELDLGANELHRMKEPLEELVQALVHHHQRELTLNIYFNHLSPEYMWRFKTLCQNMDIVLEFG